LEHVVAAVEEAGSRPPGLLVVGHCCDVLKGSGGSKWVVEEGFTELDAFMAESQGTLPQLLFSQDEI
jgi:uroporphyrin-III C-methyltransferase